MSFKRHPLGWIGGAPGVTVFFGAKDSQIQNLRAHFPQWNFLRTRQVHGTKVIEQDNVPTDYEIEADGSWTRRPKLALCSVSADCVPLLIRAPGFVMALHAGWRGVAGRILVSGLDIAVAQSVSPAELKIWIGPHIRENSFLVRSDALAPLAHSCRRDISEISETSGDDQYRVNLEMILRSQASEFGVTDAQIESLGFDTFQERDLHSHRRDREKAGRQISFIVLESQT